MQLTTIPASNLPAYRDLAAVRISALRSAVGHMPIAVVPGSQHCIKSDCGTIMRRTNRPDSALFSSPHLLSVTNPCSLILSDRLDKHWSQASPLVLFGTFRRFHSEEGSTFPLPVDS